MIKVGTKVVWANWHKHQRTNFLTLPSKAVIEVSHGIVVAHSRLSAPDVGELVIVEWDWYYYPVSVENVEDLIDIDTIDNVDSGEGWVLGG